MRQLAGTSELRLPAATCDAEARRLRIRALPHSAPLGMMRVGVAADALTQGELTLLRAHSCGTGAEEGAEIFIELQATAPHDGELFRRADAAWTNATAKTERPQLMGVVNTTPDSFSDGGEYHSASDPRPAIEHALQLVREGCELLDIGGESTRPGAAAVSTEEELGRVIPVISALSSESPCPISVDTQKAAVAAAAIDAGASMVNDVSAGLTDSEMLPLVAERGVKLCLMHMRGTPRDMQEAPRYDDVLRDVLDHLRERASACLKAGIEGHKILIDPGIGFGKTLEHNLELLRGLPTLRSLGLPLLLGVSRKSFIAQLTAAAAAEAVGAPVERLGGTIAALLRCVDGGASCLRVHDVAAAREALLVHRSLEAQGS